MGLRESLDNQVSQYTSTAYASVDADQKVIDAARMMQAAGTTEAIATRKGEPVGIITERDILYKVVAPGLNAHNVKVVDVMTSPVETVDEASKVSDAISKMSKLGVRRLGVTRNGKIIGMVTQKSVVSGNVDTSFGLPELSKPDQVSCPYCGATMKDRDELSRHIDQVHLGLGLLEGDRTKW